jgi:hypothetical protein
VGAEPALMQEYTVCSDPTKKGRSFTARCVALVVADHMWASGNSDNVRPIWAQFVGSDAEMRPFATNMVLGRKLEKSGGSRRASASDRIEFLKSAGYQLAWQREPEGTILTAFLPDLFRLDPGMVDPAGAAFVMLTPRWWLEAQTLPADAACASLFAAMLDRRTRCPLPADVTFYQQMMAAAIEQGLARPVINGSVTYARNFAAEGLEAAGFDMNGAIAFSARHETLETFLAEQCTEFFAAKEMA